MVQSLGVVMSEQSSCRSGKAQARAGLAALACALLACSAMPGLAEDSKPAAGPTLKLELNRLEPTGESCRTYLLVDNKAGPALKSLKADLYAFDTDGVAQKRVAVELGPIQEKKTVVRLFDFAGIACPKIGRVLLNDLLACEGGDATRETCLDRIETTTKTNAEFAK